ncbi:Protein shuttle craft [Orchesella cincta]|uniref:Protein shuttle craft n=1 Tax=Orchesella cincta TaxID=48709 RepID=A0A1D2M8S5_ORCCI|nr:Protein shuttle craft [Orchesella cincta]
MKPEDYKCKAKCEKLCSLGHPCGAEHACHEPCPDCQTQVVKSLPCHPNHKATLACHDDGINYKCMEITEKELECGHKSEQECHADPKEIVCNELTLKKYPDCGHERYILCFLQTIMVCQKEACRREARRIRKTDE